MKRWIEVSNLILSSFFPIFISHLRYNRYDKFPVYTRKYQKINYINFSFERFLRSIKFYPLWFIETRHNSQREKFYTRRNFFLPLYLQIFDYRFIYKKKPFSFQPLMEPTFFLQIIREQSGNGRLEMEWKEK